MGSSTESDSRDTEHRGEILYKCGVGPTWGMRWLLSRHSRIPRVLSPVSLGARVPALAHGESCSRAEGDARAWVWRLSAIQASQAAADGYIMLQQAGPGQLLAISTIHSWFLFTLLCLAKLQPKQLRREIATWVKFWTLIAKKYLQAALSHHVTMLRFNSQTANIRCSQILLRLKQKMPQMEISKRVPRRNSCNFKCEMNNDSMFYERSILAIWMIPCNKPWVLPEIVYCEFESFLLFIFCFEQKIQGPRKRQTGIPSPDGDWVPSVESSARPAASSFKAF